MAGHTTLGRACQSEGSQGVRDRFHTVLDVGVTPGDEMLRRRGHRWRRHQQRQRIRDDAEAHGQRTKEFAICLRVHGPCAGRLTNNLSGFPSLYAFHRSQLSEPKGRQQS